MPSNWPSWEHAAYALIAVIGGIARYLDSYLKGQTAPTWSRMTAHAVVSGFSGYMAAHATLLIKPEWTFIVAGVAGYLGTQALDFMADVIKKRAGGDNP